LDKLEKMDQKKQELPVIGKENNKAVTSIVPDTLPLEGEIYVTSAAGPRHIKGKPDIHHGIDLRAKPGTYVFATFSGRVESATTKASGYGGMIVIRNDETFATYGHVTPMVKAGDKIEAGTRIGEVMELTAGQKSTGPHLHYEISIGSYGIGSQRVNPQSFHQGALGQGVGPVKDLSEKLMEDGPAHSEPLLRMKAR
jgi:murein DD-endopeptidase MepM/ murein hydrolase activator NlpD